MAAVVDTHVAQRNSSYQNADDLRAMQAQPAPGQSTDCILSTSSFGQRACDGQADQAAQQLLDQLDHEQHVGMLQKYGINPQDLTE